jgi:hypothetical protein
MSFDVKPVSTGVKRQDAARTWALIDLAATDKANQRLGVRMPPPESSVADISFGIGPAQMRGLLNADELGEDHAHEKANDHD